MGKSTGKKQTGYIGQGGIIAMATLVVMLCSLVKQIILTSKWGDVGNSIFSTAYESYVLLSVLTGLAFPEVMRSLLKPRMKQGKFKNIAAACHTGILFGLISGLAGMAALFVGRNIISEHLLYTPSAGAAIMVLAPVFFFSCMNGILRGIFLGLGITMPVAVSMLAEQIISLIVGFPMAAVLHSYGKKASALLMNDSFTNAFSVAGFMTGYLVGGALTFLFLFVLYLFSGKILRNSMKEYDYEEEYGSLTGERARNSQRKAPAKSESISQLSGIFIKFLIPIALLELFGRGLLFFDQLLFFNVGSAHFSEEALRVQWGIYYGKYKVLTLIPLAVVTAMCAFLNKRIQTMNKKYAADRVREMVFRLLHGVLLTAIPLAVMIIALSGTIIAGLYGAPEDEMAPELLMIGGISVIFYSLAIVWLQVLLGQKIRGIWLFLVGILAAALRYTAMYVLITSMELDVVAVLYADLLFSFFLCMVGEIMVHRRIRFRQSIWYQMIPMVVAALIMGFIQFLLSKAFGGMLPGLLLSVLLLLLGYVLYFGILSMLKAVSAKDLQKIPLGGLGSVIARILGRT